MSKLSLMEHEAMLNPKLGQPDVEQEPIRAGFGRGLVAAGQANKAVVALCADLTGSTKMDEFAKAFPDRFFQVGIAEQNLAAVASGMAAMGMVPFMTSYAAFSPGRNWEQIKTTICLNEQPVIIVGSHAGLYTGADGATHQMLEDIALMRVLPHMRVVVPCDSVEAEKATVMLATQKGPGYLRVARDKTPVITTKETPFSLAKAQILRGGSDITIAACGTMVYQALMAAELLHKAGVSAEVINVAVIKPLDTETILRSVRKTGCLLSAEEAQIGGGLGGALAELLGESEPLPMTRMGMVDHFGQSGTPDELLNHFGLNADSIALRAAALIKRKK